MNFTTEAICTSSCLLVLHLEMTCSSGEEGDMLFKALAEGELKTLEVLKIKYNEAWFANDREGCMDPLLVFLARQAKLLKITM